MVDDSLRQRLAAELAEADPCCGLTHADDYADAALAVFADDLRQLANQIENGPTFAIPATVIAELVREHAAEIDPKGDDHV